MANNNFEAVVDGNDVQYQWVKKLGQGAYGIVALFNATRKVAIKRVWLGGANLRENKKLLRMAEDEGKVLATLCHPNIVRIFHTWRDDTTEEIVMELEYCGGESLKVLTRKNLREKKYFDQSTIRKWLVQLALGIGYIHDMGIVHRDLKADNVLLSSDLTVVKIADFGTAKLTNSGAPTLTDAIGTLNYMSPEVAEEGNAALKSDPKVDVWAYGVIAYEMAVLDVPVRINTLNGFREFKTSGLQELKRLQHPDDYIELLEKCLLVYEPSERANMEKVTAHRYLRDETSRLQKGYANYLHDQMKELQRKVSVLEQSNRQLRTEAKEAKAEQQQTVLANRDLRDRLEAAEKASLADRAKIDQLTRQLDLDRQAFKASIDFI